MADVIPIAPSLDDMWGPFARTPVLVLHLAMPRRRSHRDPNGNNKLAGLMGVCCQNLAYTGHINSTTPTAIISFHTSRTPQREQRGTESRQSQSLLSSGLWSELRVALEGRRDVLVVCDLSSGMINGRMLLDSSPELRMHPGSARDVVSTADVFTAGKHRTRCSSCPQHRVEHTRFCSGTRRVGRSPPVMLPSWSAKSRGCATPAMALPC